MVLRKKWAVKCIIVDEREGGGMEYSEDLVRRIYDRQHPGKVFYQMKKRKIRTQPIHFHKLIPGPKGKKILFLYGVSRDEVFPVEFHNIKEVMSHAQNEFGDKLYFKTRPIQAKNDQGILLFYVVKNGNTTKELTIENTGEPVIEKYDIAYHPKEYDVYDKESGKRLYYIPGEGGQPSKETTTKKTPFPVMELKKEPIITTEETAAPYMERVKAKIVKPVAQKLRYWLARTQEEDRIKYEYKSWFDKYGYLFVILIVSVVMIVAISVTINGINDIVKQSSVISDGLGSIAAAMKEIAEELAATQGTQIIRSGGP